MDCFASLAMAAVQSDWYPLWTKYPPRRRALAAAGYVVFSPDSFARTGKPASCNVATHEGGLDRNVLALRQTEAANAVAQVERLRFVDSRHVYLYGFSEGAIATATAREISVRARIVEGWTCHAAWPEYVGLRIPPGLPALTLTSQNDPWFQADWARGNCGAFMKGCAGSRSVVFAAPDPLSGQHYVSERINVQATILNLCVSINLIAHKGSFMRGLDRSIGT